MKTILTTITLLMLGTSMAVAQEEQRYYWETEIVVNEEARTDIGIPLNIGNGDADATNDRQFRGIGQVFNPNFNHDWYAEYAEAGDSVPVPWEGMVDRMTFLERFLGTVTSYSIDTVTAFVYSRDENAANNTETLGGAFELYKTDYNFGGIQYRTVGFTQALADLEGPLESDFLDAPTLAGQFDQVAGRISTLVFTYAEGDAVFTEDESAIFVFQVPVDPSYTGATIQERIDAGGQDQRYFFISQTEYRTGDYAQADGTPDTRADSISRERALGLVMMRDGNNQNNDGAAGTDTLHSGWSELVLGGKPFIFNTQTHIRGTMSIGDLSVRYFYGNDASDQGLSAVTPNPARDVARLPFSLTEPGVVNIEVYDAEGRQRAMLVENGQYIPGNYDVVIPTTSLGSGTYVARMTIGERAYTMKFNVAL